MNVHQIQPGYVNQELVEFLESMLEQAKSGKVVDFAYIAGWTEHRYNLGWHFSDQERRLAMIGQLRTLDHELVTDVLLSRTDSILTEALE